MMIKAKTLTISVILFSIFVGYLFTKEPEVDSRVKMVDTLSSGIIRFMGWFGFSRSILNSIVPKVPAGDGAHEVFSEDLTGLPPLQRSVFPGIVEPAPFDLRFYYPKGNEAKLPIIIFFHGGGNVMGHPQDIGYDAISRRLAQAGPFVVASVDYRLSPEYRFPASIDDALAALVWVHSNAHPLLQKHADTSKIVIAGDSNGAYLAIAATQHAVDHYPHIKISSQIALYPTLHMLSPVTDSKKAFKDGIMIDEKRSAFFKNLSLPAHPEFVNSALYQPLLGTNFQKFPPTHVLVAGKDMLRDEGILYFNVLKQAGVKAHVHLYEKAVHGFFGFDFLPEAQQAFQDLLAVLREHLNDL